jgi:hypothetical protein
MVQSDSPMPSNDSRESLHGADAISIIMDLGTEDYYGLYEVIWALNNSHRGVSSEATLSMAKLSMASLLNRGHVKLYRTVWLNDTHEPLSDAEADSVIRRSSSWAEPAAEGAGEYYCFAATAAGEKAYYGGDFKS